MRLRANAQVRVMPGHRCRFTFAYYEIGSLKQLNGAVSFFGRLQQDVAMIVLAQFAAMLIDHRDVRLHRGKGIVVERAAVDRAGRPIH